MSSPHAVPKPPPGPWAALANCADTSPDLFFPEQHMSSSTAANAKTVCNGCVVRNECFEYAMMSPVEYWGVWGGTSRPERIRIERARKLIEANE